MTERPLGDTTPAPARAARLAAVLILLGVIAVAYHGALRGPFVFDDGPAIVENPTIRSFAQALAPPSDRGLPVTGRPLVNLSLAVNYAWSGLDPRGYHVVNILLHALAALALLGVIHRALRRVDKPDTAPDSSRAWWTAVAVATVWAAHPLQTAAVSYVSQRAEIMVALFYLLTLYAFQRATEANGPSGGRRGWLAASVAACAAGMATKEVMVTAPVVMLLFDRAFVAGTFRGAIRQRAGYYAALAGTWLLLAWLMRSTGDRAGTAGFGIGVSPWAYALQQCEAIVHYVRLAVWPDRLVFDYGGSLLIHDWKQVWPQGLLLVAALCATAIAVWRWPRAGFVAATFFAILAPTSSFVPLADSMFEHRMYLPLAAIVASLAVALLQRPRVLIPAVALLACGAAWATVQRNRVYQDEVALWRDTVAKRPQNVRAHYTLGSLLAGREQWDAAIACYEAALKLDPQSSPAHNNLGNALVQTGRLADAVPHYEAALRTTPSADTFSNLGNALLRLGRAGDARAHYEAALKLRPNHADALNNLGNILAEAGEFAAAADHYARALQVRPDLADAHANLANVLAQTGRAADALPHYEEALRLRPDFLDARFNLATALTELRRWSDAIAQYQEVQRRRPDYPGLRERLMRVDVMRDVYGDRRE